MKEDTVWSASKSNAGPSLVVITAWLMYAFIIADNRRLLYVSFSPSIGQFSLPLSFVLTFFRVLVGTALAIGFGMSLAVVLRVMGESLSKACLPLAFLAAVTPAPIWITISIMVVGLSEQLTVFVVFASSAFFVLAISIFHVTQIPARLFFLGTLYGHNSVEKIKWIIWPELSAKAVVTARIAFLVGWSSVIVSESAGSQSGLGAMLVFGRQVLDWQIIMLAWLTILLGALATDALISRLLDWYQPLQRNSELSHANG